MTHSKSTTQSRFAHKRLDVYHIALRLFAGVEKLAAGFPRGHAGLKDQIRRAAAAGERESTREDSLQAWVP